MMDAARMTPFARRRCAETEQRRLDHLRVEIARRIEIAQSEPPCRILWNRVGWYYGLMLRHADRRALFLAGLD